MAEHDGHRERLRARFRSAGLEAFSPHEALELLLTYAIPRRDVKPIAKELLRRFGSLHAVLQATQEELMQTDGVGENAATLLTLMTPLFRAYRKSAEEEAPDMKNGAQTVRYCEALFEGERYERFYVIALDGRMRRINTTLISSGDVAEVRVYSRHVVSALTQCSAVGAVLAHNHPGGSARPSREDIELTSAIGSLLESLGIRLYDHIIVSARESFSFRLGGLIGAEDGSATRAAQRYDRMLPALQDELYHAGTIAKGEYDACMEMEEGDLV